MWYIYILYSNKLDKLYIGKTRNLKRRFREHNSGNSAFSKNGMPWKIIYYSAFSNKEDARLEEVFLKSGKGRERVNYLLGNTLDKLRRGG